MFKLVEYDDDEDGETTNLLVDPSSSTSSTAASDVATNNSSTSLQISICAAPDVVPLGNDDGSKFIEKNTKELTYNMPYNELFAPENGPIYPKLTSQQRATRNMLSGYVEQAHLNSFEFENQRRTFSIFGYAMDPSVTETTSNNVVARIPDVSLAPAKDNGESQPSAFEKPKVKPEKRKREKNDDPADIEGFRGPWAPLVDEQRNVGPSEEDAAIIEEMFAKRHKTNKRVEQKPIEEKTVLHIKDPYDYQGRSFLHPPHDVGVNLRPGACPSRCFLPKNQIHTWEGHTKGINAIRWFPKSAHLLLSSGMDGRVKIWEVYHERRCVRTYYGHRESVRDICFNNVGTQFLTASYDRYMKLWDTETGACISRFTSRKIPFCVKFNPEEDKQHLFVAGMADKKIVCWDTRSEEIVQEYDRHLGAVNSITFVDDNRRFVSTSDDKSLRVWEWDIPVDMKYIADPTMHSMPAVTRAPNNKWLACQSMDNKIVIFSALNRFKLNRKKTFHGHMVAGYACSVDFSPEMSYVISGDADGKCYIWDWKTTKLFKKWKAHDKVCIAALWHPHETSKVVTAGWDGLIKFWD